MSSLNLAQIIGNVGRDPEIRSTADGKRVANLTVATTERWKGRDGEQREATEWHRLTVWSEGLVGVIERYVHKGDKIYAAGKIQTRKWQDQSGQDRYSTEIVLQGFDAKLVLLGGSKSSDQGDGDAGRDAEAYAKVAATKASGGGRARPIAEDLDDDVPFAPETRA